MLIVSVGFRILFVHAGRRGRIWGVRCFGCASALLGSSFGSRWSVGHSGSLAGSSCIWGYSLNANPKPGRNLGPGNATGPLAHQILPEVGGDCGQEAVQASTMAEHCLWAKSSKAGGDLSRGMDMQCKQTHIHMYITGKQKNKHRERERESQLVSKLASQPVS